MAWPHNPHLEIIEVGEGVDTVVMQRVWHTREKMGAPLFNALLRGLILADRLHTFGMLIVRVGDGKAGTPPSRPPLDLAGAERQDLVWSSTVWMRAFSDVVDAMLEAGIQGLLTRTPTVLVAIRGITDRWKTEIFARMRNEVAAHVDPDVIERGLELARASGETSARLLTVGWDVEVMAYSQLRAIFAHGVQISGLFAPSWPGEGTEAAITQEVALGILGEAEREMGEVLGQIGSDQGELPGLMRALIFDCADALHLGEVPAPVPATRRPGHAEVNDRTRQELDVVGRTIDGWSRTDGNVEKVRRIGEALRALRQENKALREATKRTD